jgi:hypothetical protein
MMSVIHAISIFIIAIFYVAFGSMMFHRPIGLISGAALAAISYLCFLPMVHAAIPFHLTQWANDAMVEQFGSGARRKVPGLGTIMVRAICAIAAITIIGTLFLAARGSLQYRNEPQTGDFVSMAMLAACIAISLFFALRWASRNAP